jgi:gas vesicle protein
LLPENVISGSNFNHWHIRIFLVLLSSKTSKTMGTTSYKDKLGRFIQKAQSEIDELRLKIALGKMDGADLFEDMKKELRESVSEFNAAFDKEKMAATETIIKGIETLQLQLALGKAEALDAYEGQKEKILHSITQLENELKENRSELMADARMKIQNELEKFRLKMEILQIRYELGKIDLKDNIEEKKSKFKKEFDQLIENLKDESSEQLAEYGKDLKEAYEKLRKSLT